MPSEQPADAVAPAAPTQFRQIRAHAINPGNILRVGNGIAYRVKHVGVAFVADGTVRVELDDFMFHLVIDEMTVVDIIP